MGEVLPGPVQSAWSEMTSWIQVKSWYPGHPNCSFVWTNRSDRSLARHVPAATTSSFNRRASGPRVEREGGRTRGPLGLRLNDFAPESRRESGRALQGHFGIGSTIVAFSFSETSPSLPLIRYWIFSCLRTPGVGSPKTEL